MECTLGSLGEELVLPEKLLFERARNVDFRLSNRLRCRPSTQRRSDQCACAECRLCNVGKQLVGCLSQKALLGLRKSRSGSEKLFSIRGLRLFEESDRRLV